MVAAGWSTLIEGLHGALDEVSSLDPGFLPTALKSDLLLDLARVETRLTELRLRLLACAEDVAARDGSRDAAAWLAHRIQADYVSVRADLELGRSLAALPALTAALGDGKVRPEQAQVIAAALEALPADVGTHVRADAEAWLVQAAGHHSPRELRILGRKILDVVAPEIAEAHEAKRLAEEEAGAEVATRLKLKDLPNGTTRITGVVPVLVGRRLRTYLEALSSPRVMQGLGPRQRRFGAAFCSLLDHLDPAALPDHGGAATTVIVTIDRAALMRDLAAAGLLGDQPISAAAARRLACNAKILPVVLGGKGEILDLGRSRRLFSSAQHHALRLRDRRCRGEGCTVPAAWCEAHHLSPWSRGGRTDLADGVLLCSHHHHRIHDPAYTPELLANGDVRFRRRE